MSIRHINAALYLELADPACKAVLIGLANHADPVTGECYPGLERLRRYTGMAERTVRDALRRCEKLGLVKTIPRPGTSNRYILMLSDPDLPRQMPPDPRRNLPDPPATAAGEPSLNQNQPSKTRARQAEPGPAGEVPEDWTPSKALIEWAEARYPEVDIEAQVEPFIRKNRANGIPVRHIDEAFKGWLGRIKTLRHPVPTRAAKTKREAVEQKWTDEEKAAQAHRTIAVYRRMGRDMEADAIERDWRGHPDFENLRRTDQ